MLKQVVNHFDLVRNLGPAEDRHKRFLRSLQCFAQVVQLLFEQQPGRRLRDEMRDPLGRSMCPVSAAKGVIHIDVTKAGELSREVHVVGFLARMEAQILEQQHLPRLQLARQLGGHVAHAIRRKGDVDRLA